MSRKHKGTPRTEDKRGGAIYKEKRVHNELLSRKIQRTVQELPGNVPNAPRG